VSLAAEVYELLLENGGVWWSSDVERHGMRKAEM